MKHSPTPEEIFKLLERVRKQFDRINDVIEDRLLLNGSSAVQSLADKIISIVESKLILKPDSIQQPKQNSKQNSKPQQPKPDPISYPNPDINPDIEIPTWFKDQDDPNVTESLKEIMSAIINWTPRTPHTISKETCESLKALYPNKEDRILAVDGDCFITRDIHKLNYVFSFSYKPDSKSDSWYTREPLTLENRLTKHGNNSTKFYLKFATKYGLLDS